MGEDLDDFSRRALSLRSLNPRTHWSTHDRLHTIVNQSAQPSISTKKPLGVSYKRVNVPFPSHPNERASSGVLRSLQGSIPTSNFDGSINILSRGGEGLEIEIPTK